jgi:hypothetical protein
MYERKFLIMTNEDFQNKVLQQFAQNNESQESVLTRLENIEESQKYMGVRFAQNNESQKSVLKRLENIEESQKYMVVQSAQNNESQKSVLKRLENIEESQKYMGVRQDEIFQVVKAVEHLSKVGKAEIDHHNFRIAKVEGTIKKVGRIMQEELEVVSNL